MANALAEALVAGITAQVNSNSPEAKMQSEVISDYIKGNRVSRATDAVNAIVYIGESMSNSDIDDVTKANLAKLQGHIAALATS